MRISDWSSDVCSSDLTDFRSLTGAGAQARVDGAEWTVGSPAWFQASGVNLNDIASRIAELQERGRSGERAGGKEGVWVCRVRWRSVHSKKNSKNIMSQTKYSYAR